MTESEVTEFEEYFLNKPEVIEDIELGQLSIKGLRDNPMTSDARVPERSDWWARIFRLGPSPVWAVACALLVVAIVSREVQH